jgi:hypothetical protein
LVQPTSAAASRRGRFGPADIAWIFILLGAYLTVSGVVRLVS